MKRPPPRAAPLLFLFASGCWDAASQVSSNLNQLAWHIALVVAGLFGLIGALQIWSAVRAQRLGWVELVAAWLVGGMVIAAQAFGTELFHPWPGTFSKEGAILLALSTPAAIALPLVTGEFVHRRLPAPRATAARATGGAIALGYAALLLRAALFSPAPPVDGKIAGIGVSDRTSFCLTDRGQLVAMWGSALPGHWRTLRANEGFAVAIDDTGRLYAIADAATEPLAIDVPAPVRDVGVAGYACAVDAGGQVRCFTYDPIRRDSPLPDPFLVAGYSNAVEVAVGDRLLCVKDELQRVQCDAFVRQPGDADHSGDSAPSANPADPARPADPANPSPSAVAPSPPRHEIEFPEPVTSFAATRTSACAVSGGHVSCAGENESGELGKQGEGSASPALVPDLRDVAEIVAGTFHLCARTNGGDVLCWGGNGWAQLGLGSLGKAHPEPVRIPLPAPARALFPAPRSTCAELADRRFFCWGAQVETGAVFAGTVCDKPWFGPPVVCADHPSEVRLPTTAIPFRSQAGW